MQIVLLPKTPKGTTLDKVSKDQVEQEVEKRGYGAAPLIIACDFYITGIEAIGTDVPGGYQAGRVLNIDHHAPTKRMERFVSSGNLAIERLQQTGQPPADAVVVITHTDCDSVISSAIISGRLPPDADLGAAVIAADHTGAENELADMLQCLQEAHDLELSLRNANLLRAGQPLEVAGQEALTLRQRRRAAARTDVPKFQRLGGLVWADLDEDTDGELYLPLLADASLIMLTVPRTGDPTRKNVKLRVGLAAPEGFAINALRLGEFDPNYGGRWNAGSNKRGGGTDRGTEEYAVEVSRRLAGVV